MLGASILHISAMYLILYNGFEKLCLLLTVFNQIDPYMRKNPYEPTRLDAKDNTLVQTIHEYGWSAEYGAQVLGYNR